MTRDTEKCPLSVLTGVRIKRVILEKIYQLFVGTNETVRIKRVSIERGSTVTSLRHFFAKKNRVLEMIILRV